MKGRILVVDDEREIRDFLSRHLRYCGYEVETACDGVEALEKLEQVRVDVMVSDIRMPRMDGVMLLEHVRREFPMVRTIMITGYVAQEAILACMREGAETCVFKPLEDLSELEDAVEAAVSVIRKWWQILGNLRSVRPDQSGAGGG
ncbi:MAG: response regulator [Myxococcales bacterium]|nr:response regulator [Myxococcales bacterium]MDD9971092.1 response regulator [Myxococcales bacterium]